MRLVPPAAAVCMLALLSACDGGTGIVQPSDPSFTKSDESQRLITLTDACDPATFNAALGPGTCVRNGGVTFDHFIAELQRNGFAGAWHMAPATMNARVGQTLVAMNRGGEVHTFTEVEEFGGGIVPALNQLSGNTTVAPECQHLAPDDFIQPGGQDTDDEVEKPGTEKYQCCIHPWMRMTVTGR